MNKDVIKKVLQYMESYRLFLVMSLVLALIQVAASLYLPILFGRAIDVIIGKGDVDFKYIDVILLYGVVTLSVGALAQWLMNVCNNKITYGIIKDVRAEAFRKIEILPLSYIDRHSSGDLVSRVIADVDQFADGLLMGFSQFFTGAITILGTLVFMFMLSPAIAVVVVVLTPLSFFVAKFIAGHTHDMFLKQSTTKGEQTALIDEAISNAKVVKAYSQEDNFLSRFDEINGRLKECSQKAVFYSSLVNPCTRFINALVYAAVGVLGAFLSINGMISVGMLTSFLSYANQYTKPFNEISGVITELQNALVCAGRVFELIEERPQIPDSEDAYVLEGECGQVELEKVKFSYNKGTELIKNLNLSVKKGQRVAIVGPTGCGKSTLINLLMRFYDVDNGQICVEGKNIKDITRKSLRRNYGMVLQETWLKNASVFENIRMGRNVTMEQVIEAAKQSHADSFIRRLPDGYDTVLKEDGGSLSAGQKQLLCIARVMLSVPPMLILDEATSSIDTRTEQKIQSAFGKMMQGRTSFIVAHRLSTIMNADVILVMKDGDIIEQGNHDSLMEQGGFYAELYKSQWK